jgi:hypothetical protein
MIDWLIDGAIVKFAEVVQLPLKSIFAEVLLTFFFLYF